MYYQNNYTQIINRYICTLGIVLQDFEQQSYEQPVVAHERQI